MGYNLSDTSVVFDWTLSTMDHPNKRNCTDDYVEIEYGRG